MGLCQYKSFTEKIEFFLTQYDIEKAVCKDEGDGNEEVLKSVMGIYSSEQKAMEKYWKRIIVATAMKVYFFFLHDMLSKPDYNSKYLPF